MCQRSPSLPLPFPTLPVSKHRRSAGCVRPSGTQALDRRQEGYAKLTQTQAALGDIFLEPISQMGIKIIFGLVYIVQYIKYIYIIYTVQHGCLYVCLCKVLMLFAEFLAPDENNIENYEQ